MTITTGYFIDASPSDPNAVWTWDDRAFNGDEDPTDYAYTFDNGSISLNYNYGKTTNISEVSGETITEVKVRLFKDNTTGTVNGAIYTQSLGELLGTAISPDGASWGDWLILSTPISGWTWDKVANLEAKLYKTGGESFIVVNVVKIEVTSELDPTKTSIGSANARIAVTTESDGTFNSRINVVTESIGSFNARIYIATINETSIDVTLKTSTNKNIQLKAFTNKIIKLKSSTNKNIILK